MHESNREGAASSAADDRRIGLWSGVLLLLKSTMGLVLNRFELAALELALLRRRFVVALFLAGLGLCAVAFGSFALAALFVFLTWDAWGGGSLFLVAVAYFVAAWGLLVLASRRVESLGLALTMSELRRDKQMLMGESDV